VTGDSFNRGMQMLRYLWPERTVGSGVLDAYWQTLNDLDDSVWEPAILAAARDCTFFPKPAELRERAIVILTRYGLLPVDPPTAWREVLYAVRHLGVAAIVETHHQWSNPAILGAVEDLGGIRV